MAEHIPNRLGFAVSVFSWGKPKVVARTGGRAAQCGLERHLQNIRRSAIVLMPPNNRS
jgi:hypothetical protein